MRLTIVDSKGERFTLDKPCDSVKFDMATGTVTVVHNQPILSDVIEHHDPAPEVRR